MNNSVIRIGLAVLLGYVAYAAAALLLGARPDGVGDWIGMAVKGFLFVGIAIAVVEWANRRKKAGVEAAPESGEG